MRMPEFYLQTLKANDKTTTVFTRQDYMQNLELNAMYFG